MKWAFCVKKECRQIVPVAEKLSMRLLLSPTKCAINSEISLCWHSLDIVPLSYLHLLNNWKHQLQMWTIISLRACILGVSVTVHYYDIFIKMPPQPSQAINYIFRLNIQWMSFTYISIISVIIPSLIYVHDIYTDSTLNNRILQIRISSNMYRYRYIK